MARDFYEVLDADEDASPAAIQRAYRERARRYHPDVNDHPRAREQFTLLTTARDVLTDPEERDRYDELGHERYVEEHLDDLPMPPMSPDAADDPGVDETEVQSAARDASAAPAGTQGMGSRFAPGGTDPQARSNGQPTDQRSAAAGTASPSVAAPEPAGGGRDDGSVRSGGGHADGGVSWEKSRRRQAARQERTRGHLTASFRWVPLVLAAVLYALGLGRYLRVNRVGFEAVASAFRSGPMTGLTALHGRAGVQSSLEFVRTMDPLRSEVSYGTALVLGGVALGVLMVWSVWELRRKTNWAPSWLHAGLALGPLASFALTTLVGRVGAPVVPLWLDALLLVVFPALSVFSFLVNRFLLVLPLVRE